MASFSYLFKNRAVFPIWSKAFYKAWAKRLLCFPALLKRNIRRTVLIRGGAAIDATAEIGEVFIEGPARLLRVGKSTFIGKVHIALYEHVTIGDFTCINDGVRILTGSHNVSDPEWQHIKKPVIIGDYVWIAMDSIILPGVTIGNGAVIGAGSVVTRSVEEYQIVAGNPARPIEKKRVQQLKYNPCEFLAANQAWLKG